MKSEERIHPALKEALLDNLHRVGIRHGADKRFLISPNASEKSTWTPNELIEEVKNETPMGVGFANSVLNLTIDLLLRGKINTNQGL